MHTFMDNFNQGRKYSAQIDSHQAELTREGKFTDQKYLSISSLQTYYLNIYISSGCGRNSERENTVQTKCTFCGGANQSKEMFFKRIRKEKEKYRAAGDSNNKQTERTPRKCFRCGSEDHLIVKFPKPPKENQKHRKKVSFNEKVNRAYDNGKNNSDQKIYAYMACMSDNEGCPSGNFGDSSQLTNWILDSVSTYHMTP